MKASLPFANVSFCSRCCGDIYFRRALLDHLGQARNRLLLRRMLAAVPCSRYFLNMYFRHALLAHLVQAREHLLCLLLRMRAAAICFCWDIHFRRVLPALGR